MQAFYGFPQRGSGAALNLCCVRMKSHSRWCLNTSCNPQPAKNPSLLTHKWEIKNSTCCASSRVWMEGAVGPPCHPPAPGPPPAAPLLLPPMLHFPPQFMETINVPEHTTSNSRVFQNPHHTAVPPLPPSVGSTENQTNTAQVVKITLLVAGTGESLGCGIRGSYPCNSPGFVEHTRRPGHPLLRALSRAGALGVGR